VAGTRRVPAHSRPPSRPAARPQVRPVLPTGKRRMACPRSASTTGDHASASGGTEKNGGATYKHATRAHWKSRPRRHAGRAACRRDTHERPSAPTHPSTVVGRRLVGRLAVGDGAVKARLVDVRDDHGRREGRLGEAAAQLRNCAHVGLPASDEAQDGSLVKAEAGRGLIMI